MKIPMHPGEYLLEAYMKPMGLSSNRLAKAVGVSTTSITRIVRQELLMSMDMIYRISKALGTSVDQWVNLHNEYQKAKTELDLDLSNVKVLHQKRWGIKNDAS